MMLRTPTSTLFPYTTLFRSGSGRAWTPVEHDGRPVALLVYDASLAEEPELVRAVGGAAGLALENERLDAELRANLRSEEHTSELQSRLHLVCRLLLEKKK